MSPDPVRGPVPDRPHPQVVPGSPEALFHPPQPVVAGRHLRSGHVAQIGDHAERPVPARGPGDVSSSATSRASPSTATMRFAPPLEIRSRELLLRSSLRIRRFTVSRRSWASSRARSGHQATALVVPFRDRAAVRAVQRPQGREAAPAGPSAGFEHARGPLPGSRSRGRVPPSVTGANTAPAQGFAGIANSARVAGAGRDVAISGWRIRSGFGRNDYGAAGCPVIARVRGSTRTAQRMLVAAAAITTKRALNPQVA